MDTSFGFQPHKRHRPALNCSQCRRRKVKCDRLLPCNQCVKIGASETCEYSTSRIGQANYTALENLNASAKGENNTSFNIGVSPSRPLMPDILPMTTHSEKPLDMKQQNEKSIEDLQSRVRSLEQQIHQLTNSTRNLIDTGHRYSPSISSTHSST